MPPIVMSESEKGRMSCFSRIDAPAITAIAPAATVKIPIPLCNLPRLRNISLVSGLSVSPAVETPVIFFAPAPESLATVEDAFAEEGGKSFAFVRSSTIRDVSEENAGGTIVGLAAVLPPVSATCGADEAGATNPTNARKAVARNSLSFLQCPMRKRSFRSYQNRCRVVFILAHTLDILNQLLEPGFFKLHENSSGNAPVLADYQPGLLEFLMLDLLSNNIMVLWNVVSWLRMLL